VRSINDGNLRRVVTAVVSALLRKGVDCVLIGSSILPLIYGLKWEVHDIDLFIINKSTIMEPEIFEEIARENDWDVGMDMHGMMYYEVLVDGDVVRVDLMENILDIYIPEPIIANSIIKKLDGTELRAIRLEDLVVLKAREASEEGDEFLSKIAELTADPEGRVKLDKDYLRRVIEYFPEDERDSITRRLERSGIYME